MVLQRKRSQGRTGHMIKLINAFLIHFSSVPSQSPRDIKLTHTSNHSVKVTWNEVKWCFRHGLIQSYEVHFRDEESGSTDLMQNVTVQAGAARRLDFNNLEIYWQYGVRIKAFTRHGPGPWSDWVKGRTDEWGMLDYSVK